MMKRRFYVFLGVVCTSVAVFSTWQIWETLHETPQYLTDYSQQEPIILPVNPIKEVSSNQRKKSTDTSIKSGQKKSSQQVSSAKVQTSSKKSLTKTKVSAESKGNRQIVKPEPPRMNSHQATLHKPYEKWLKSSESNELARPFQRDKHPCELGSSICDRDNEDVQIFGVVIGTDKHAKPLAGKFAVSEPYEMTPAVYVK
jgi:transposase